MFALILFLTAFVSLSLWFLFKENNEIRGYFGKAFIGSFACYLGLAFFMPGVVSWTALAVNLVFLFGAGLFLNTFSSSKLIFIPMLILMTIGYYNGVRGIDWFPFSSSSTESLKIDALDPDSELLLELKNGHQLTELQSIITTYNLSLEPAFVVKDGANTDLDDYYAVNIPTEQMEQYEEIIVAFETSGLIDHIEGNEILSLDPIEQAKVPAPKRRSRYAANDPDIDKVWGYEAMGVEGLYKLLATKQVLAKKKARIAIIDTGVDGEHEDLKSNFVSLGAEHDTDPHGHGTHCAGIAAAVSNNAKGIASFAPNNNFVEVTSVKVFGKYGNTTQRTIINGMLLAADNGADVLSMSLGGPTSARAQRAYKDAVKYANRKGAIVVVAAGNENIDAQKRVPASVDGVITVAALDAELKKAVFSNDVSALKMGIAAPGVQVYSTIPNNNYEYFNGTSMATPYVAGLLGLMKSIQPDLNTQQAYKILKQTGMNTRNTKATGLLISPENAVKSLLIK
ncbi:S8 family peptidase [Aureispira anguillae]|uniref:S8 family serine peptidase n=1 Tax=Aureispira anguillae TaxID=2864201 RepID=A0A916DP43_9BACT|nr:S8 family serine peptidase [Aureispira anguillae]BDS10299.1 S8 family serine peptidase [Aureispira anguillae]